MRTGSLRKIEAVLGIVLVFAIGFFAVGLFIDIQIILKYNHTPIPFTFILPFVGASIGLLLSSRTRGWAPNEFEDQNSLFSSAITLTMELHSKSPSEILAKA